MDFVGPRYIIGDGRFYSLNIMDVYTRRVIIHPKRNKGSQTTLEGVIKAWRHLGEPDYIQFDNAMSFSGSRRHLRKFSPVIRWCLLNGVQPVFIPIREPWRNGYIEKLNDSFDKKVYKRIEFKDFAHCCDELDNFEHYHNNEYRYSPLGDRTPNEIFKRDRLKNEIINCNYDIPENMPIEDGFIHVIRLIRSDLKLNIFGENFDVPENLKYEYVAATICTDSHLIRVHDSHWNSLFTIPYRIPLD